MKEFYIVLIIIILIIIILLKTEAFSKEIINTYINIKDPKVKGDFTIAIIADNHSCYFGDNDEELIENLKEGNPDLIFFTGDNVDNIISINKGLKTIENISKMAPSFYVTGNHDIYNTNIKRLKKRIRNFGVKVLEGNKEEFKINDNILEIYGYDDNLIDKKEYFKQKENIIKEIKESDPKKLKMLLSHRPEKDEEFREIGADFVFSGHAHGGQWRIPKILENGLYSPGQGIFPKYTNGLYDKGAYKLIVSRGLARENIKVPRIYNRPQIIFVRFTNL